MKRDWVITFLLIILVGSVGSISYLQFTSINKLPYIECRQNVYHNMNSHLAKFDSTYDIVIDYFAKKEDLSIAVQAMTNFVNSTKREEQFFKGKFCSLQLYKTIKKGRGRVFKYREKLVVDNDQTSMNKMLDEFQFLHAKLHNIDLDRLCCN